MRIEADSGDELLTLVRQGRRADSTEEIIAVLPPDLDEDELLALCSILAVEGVTAISGAPAPMAKRCLDTIAAIVAGDVGVIAP